MKRRILFLLPLLAGLAAAIVLTLPSVARAWDINALPIGYHVNYLAGDCPGFVVWTIYSTETISLHTCVPGWTDTLDAYVEATCPQAVCHPAPATTTSSTTVPVTTAPTTTDTVPVTTTATTTTVPPVTTDTTPITTTSTAPPVTTDTTTTTVAQPPTVTQTVIVQTSVTTTLVDPSIDQRLSLIEQRQATDEARIAALENPATAGTQIGEPKSLSPFTDSVQV